MCITFYTFLKFETIYNYILNNVISLNNISVCTYIRIYVIQSIIL